MEKNPKIPVYQFAVLFFWFSLYSYVPNLSSYMKELGLSLTMIGVVTGSYGFTQMVARIPLGILSDRIGKRKIFVSLGFLLSFLANILFLAFRQDWMLVIARGTAGLAAASWVVITVLYSSYFALGNSTGAMSRLNAFNNAGKLFSMLSAGIALTIFSGYQSMFVIGAAGAAIAFFLSLRIEENVPKDRKPITLRDFLHVIVDPRLLCVSGAMLLAQVYNTSTISGFTPILATDLGATPFLRSILSATDIALGTIGALLAGQAFVKQKIGEKRFLVTGVIGLAVVTSVVPFAPNLPLLFCLQACGGFFLGGVSALLMGLAIRHFPGDRRSTAMGCYQAIYGIGMFIGPIIVGRIGDAVGLAWGYRVVAALVLVMIPLILLWARADAKGQAA